MQKETPINNFEEFGFTADFEGEILKERDDLLIGYYISDFVGVVSNSWCKKSGESDENNVHLTPIVPEPTYPIFKKNPEGMLFRFDEPHKLADGLYHGHWMMYKDVTMLGGDTQRLDWPGWTDVPYDSERGLYDGQPCYVWYDGVPSLKFFNIDRHYEGYYESVEPIPLETLKTMPFIWGMYKQLKDTNAKG